MAEDMDAPSESEGWDSDLDDVPLYMDDESGSEASGAYSSRSRTSSDPGRHSARNQNSSRQHRLSRESSATSALESAASGTPESLSRTSSASRVPSRSNSSSGRGFSLALSDLNNAAQAPRLPQQQTTAASPQQQQTAAAPGPKPPQMQLRMPPSSNNSSSSAGTAAASPGRSRSTGMKISLPLGQQQNSQQSNSSSKEGAAASEAAGGAAPASRGKPPPLALVNTHSASPASSPQVSGRANSSSSTTYVGMGAIAPLAAKPSGDQQLVRVQLLLPAVDVYLPNLHAAAAAEPSSKGSRLAAAGGSSGSNAGQFKRSSSKLGRSSSSAAAAAAEDPDQQQQPLLSSSVAAAAAETLQQALSKALGIDQKHLVFYSYQQAAGGLQELLQQQQRHASPAKQPCKAGAPGGKSPAAAAASDSSSSSSGGDIQIAMGLSAGCDFSLAELDRVCQTAETLAHEADASRAENKQLQSELIITRLQAAEYKNDLAREVEQHQHTKAELQAARDALAAEKKASAEWQQKYNALGATLQQLKQSYDQLNAAHAGSSSSSRGNRHHHHHRSTGGGSPTKAAAAAPAAAAAGPHSGKETLASILESPEYASALSTLLQPSVLNRLFAVATAVERLPHYYAAAESLTPTHKTPPAAAAAVPLPVSAMQAAALTPRTSGSCTPRNPAVLHAAAQAAAAVTGNELRSSSSGGGSGSSSARAVRGGGSSSRSTPRVSGNGDAAAGGTAAGAGASKGSTPRQ